MAHFVGLDVSVKETAVCVVDEAGKVMRAEGGVRAGRHRHAADIDWRGLWLRWDRGRATVAVTSQRHGGSRSARDLGGDPSHEVVGFGEGMPTPARFTFSHRQHSEIPRSEASVLAAADADALTQRDFVRSVVDRWRGATRGETGAMGDGTTGDTQQPGVAISRLLDDARMQILKRSPSS